MRADAFLPYRLPASGSPQEGMSVVEGQVYDVGVKGMRFTIKAWDGGKHVFGPCPWPKSAVEPTAVGDHGTHDHADTLPTKGMRALILFLGDGIDNPWVIGVWPA